MTNYTKKQHFVSQFYLRQFTDSHNMVYCYNKHNKKQYPAHTEDICRINYLYETEYTKVLENGEKYILPNRIEDMFKELEGIYSTILPKVLKKCECNCNGKSLICNKMEKEVIADMVTNFLVRNPNTTYGFVNNDTTEQLFEEDEIVEIDTVMKAVGFGTAKPIVELLQKIALFNTETGGTAKQIKNRLKQMNCTFLVAIESEFVTSDCPVIYEIEDNEIKYILMTLSPKVALIYGVSNESKKFRNRTIIATAKYIDIFNKLYFNYDNANIIIASNYNIIEQSLMNIKETRE